MYWLTLLGSLGPVKRRKRLKVRLQPFFPAAKRIQEGHRRADTDVNG